jgi:alpha-galactosidase
MPAYAFGVPGKPGTIFRAEDNRAWLSRLCGMACDYSDNDDGPERGQGMAIINTSLGRFEAKSLSLLHAEIAAEGATLMWQAADGRVELASRWSFDGATGVWSRKDVLTNRGDAAFTVYRCQSRFSFTPARYEVYSQDSRWSTENQGAWTPLHTGTLTLRCEWGRSTEGGTPYMALRETGSDHGIAFHILPVGNWAIHVSAHAIMNALPFAVVELGHADEDLRLVLEPGESFELPEILIQPAPAGQPHLAAAGLHHYAQAAYFAHARQEPPIVYNTWFEQFEVLDVARLRAELTAAAELGCEVFVVDAGWYGPHGEQWWLQTGDWREKTDKAFRGRMIDFADEVRLAGLGFGLWMEPERISTATPIYQAHPDWFTVADDQFARANLENPAVYAYQKSEISRLVETYGLAWMKIDFNFSLGYDAGGSELARYTAAWYRLLDEIRGQYSGTFFEGCASGGMRSDLHTLTHFDGHFLTDTVNPIDVLRINEGALLRLPPGRLTKWAVLRSIGQTIPRYTFSLDQSPVAVVTPGGAGWEPSETVDVDFAALVCLPGIFGLSGDVAGLPAAAKRALAQHIAFYKEWRRFITGSIGHPLTPPRPIQDRTGWSALQLLHPQLPGCLVFAYRLFDMRGSMSFPLRGLQPDRSYRVERRGADAATIRCTGRELMVDGLVMEVEGVNRAAVYVLRPD